MTGDRVAEIRERLEPVARFAPYKVYVDRVIQSANHPEIRPFVLASNVAPAAAEFIANAPADLAYLLAEVARLRAQLDAIEALTRDGDDGSEHEHNPNCDGESTCPACWTADIRAALNQGGETNGE